MRWRRYLLASLAVGAVGGAGLLLHVNSHSYATGRVLDLCKAQFAAEFPAARARRWHSEVYDDFAKVYAKTPSLGFDYGCHVRKAGLTWAVEPDSGVLVDGDGKVLYRGPASSHPLQPGTSIGPTGPCVDGGFNCKAASERP
ncbi:MAG TPA: hypothetical protein VGW38_06820 [Chloroflexota bacterium]|nr:hypothetical protein [Chloroflexota bacterium]